jgi:hypothetical protein
MQKILKNMVTAEGYSEIVNKLREIIELQRKVNDETRKAKEDELERIFRGEGGSIDPKQSDPKKADPK